MIFRGRTVWDLAAWPVLGVGRSRIWEEALLLFFPTQLIACRVSGILYTALGALKNRGCDDLTTPA